MAQDEVTTIATSCLTAWTSGDLETARSLLADDVTFTGPMGQTEGADAYIDGIKGMAAMVDRADQHSCFADGENVCLVYDLVTHTPPATIPTAGWYQVRDGKISSVRAFFDPRPLVESS